MQNPPSRRAWLIPGLIAVILFIGGVASNLIASDIQETLKPYRRWVWLMFAVALIVAVATAIVEARRRDHSAASSEASRGPRVVNATGESRIADLQQLAGDSINRPHQLRAPVGDFIGREQEIETLIKALRHHSRACISGINGMGGIGKTELALLVAQRLSADYPEQFFINLQGTDANPRPPEEVMAICVRAFRGPEASVPEDFDELSQLYRSELSGKRALLLLDNAADTAQVLPLLPPPGSALLVTSRQGIALPGLASLTLNPLTAKEARELLLEIAPRAEPAAEQICRLCGFLPLAIRAAGSLLALTPDLSPVAYAEQLKDERNRLGHIGKEGVEIGVEASLHLSYQRLTSETARVFRLLSVFPGTLDAAAEEVVCADEGHVSLSDLVRRSLVLYDDGAKRYRLHDLARLFADAQLSEAERGVGLKRHATHYRDVLAAADALYLQGGEAITRGLALFDLEWGNIQAGHAWIAAQNFEADEDIPQLGMSYPGVGVYVLNLRQYSRERIRWWQIALAAAQRLKDRVQESAALSNLGVGYRNLGETKRAIQFYEEALIIDRELGDRKGEAVEMTNLGVAYRNLGETQRAIQFLEQALLIDRELGDRRGEGVDLGNLGTAYADLGETKRAIEFYEQQLSIVRELGDRKGEGNALCGLGVAYKGLGENKRAVQFYKQALLIDRELGDRSGEGRDLWNMSLALEQLGERAQTIQHAEQSLAILEQIEDPFVAKVRAKLTEWRNESAKK